MQTYTERIEDLHAHGFESVGINVLGTIGHVNEAWDFLPPLPYPVMVGHDGSASKSCACPNTDDFRRHVKEKYRLTAEANPDFIWVDDDIRMHHHGVAFGCFCLRCLELFGQDSREELVARLNSVDGGKVREAWVEHSARVLESLLSDIASAVHQVNPAINVGFMSVGPNWSTYSGQALTSWVNALGSKRVRPGGGFYDDVVPRAMLHKALETGRQAIALPPSVESVQYELEDFPYQKLDKSVQIVLDECTLSLLVGCNGVAFNALKDLPGSMMDYHDLMRGISGVRGIWEKLVQAQEGMQMVGLWPATDDRLMAKRQVHNGDWFGFNSDYDMSRPDSFADIGLPLTVDRGAACATLLSGRIAEAFTDDELRQMFSCGVVMDAAALQVLHERGMGGLAGVKIGRAWDNGVYERFTDHPFNGGFTGDARDVRVSFWPQAVHELVPVDPVGEISRLVGYDGSDCGLCAANFTNALGGRVVCLGYAPWERLSSSAKRSQTIAMADWASGGRLPLVIDKTLRVTPLVRESADGRRLVAVLLNTSYDSTGPFDVRLRASCGAVQLLSLQGQALGQVWRSGDDLQVRIPDIPPWQFVILIGG